MVQITQDIGVTSAVDKMALTHEWRHLRAVTGTADFGRNLKLLRKFARDVDLFFLFFSFQLCLFNEATVPGYEAISGTLSQCILFCVHMY